MESTRSSESPSTGVRVVDFDERWRADFARLNLEWVERWFSVEPADEHTLGDPDGSILERGGRILFAVDDEGRAIGTVALIPRGGGVVELSKMAVEPEARGKGVGRSLMDAAIAAFGELDAERLYLETNTVLEPAIRLYESAGFRRVDEPLEPSPYSRANVFMFWSGE